jgi:hypothetical protein
MEPHMATISNVKTSANVTPAAVTGFDPVRFEAMVAHLGGLKDIRSTTAAAAREAARAYQRARRGLFGYCLANNAVAAYKASFELNNEEKEYLG